MKYFLLMVGLLFMGCSKANPYKLVQTLDLEAAETFVQIHPADGFLYIKEYSLSSLKQDPEEFKSQVETISALAKEARYCKSRYGLSQFEAMEERIYIDRGFVTVECRLLTREKNVKTLIDSVYESLLNRPVSITIVPSDIGLHFFGKDVEIRGTNAKSVFSKGEQQVVFWRNGEEVIETVFARAGSLAKDFRSIAPYFSEDVSSPGSPKRKLRLGKRRSKHAQSVVRGKAVGVE